ncbi:benzoate-CoA ligase family protein [Amycolatopsis pithecellobii]|uniref:benzoate-CoA ligase family protein n=1 Tax=Amycolatopsis pithecellobii TaxID=664692 RepID=UPI0028A78DA7|nr:benzoate-CoA ligase family protein [Amycolatopsis pithecellobii]
MLEPSNAATYLVDRHVRRGAGERVAVMGPDRSVTYAELAQAIAAASAGWQSAGLRPEERVMLYADDHPDLLVALLSAMRYGAVPVPVSTLYTSDDLGRLLTDSRARAVVTDEKHAAEVKEAIGSAATGPITVIILSDTEIELPAPARILLWKDFVSQGHEVGPPDESTEDSPALWLYTSGTTGNPKAAMHRHGSIRFVAEAYGQGVLEIQPADRCLSASKLSFAYGLGNSCFLPLGAGATTILDPARPTPQNLLHRLLIHRPTIFFGVPSVYASFLRDESIPADAFESVRFGVSAGERLPGELQRRFQSRFGVELVNGLGMTETLHVFLSTRPGHAQADSVGSVVPGYDVKVVSEGGSPAEPGQPGTLHVRAPSAATGYWARTAATRKVFEGEWVNTGDLVRQDSSGNFTILGRTTEMIKSGGLWVSPAEIEAHLLRHPTVAEAAVVGIPNADGLEKPVACVVSAPHTEIDPETLIAHCRSALPAFKQPRQVLVFDALPITPNGKLQRHALRTAATERLKTTVPA